MLARSALALLLVVAACTSTAPPDPARIETCDDMVDAATTLVEQYLEALEGLSIAVLTGEAAVPERIAELDAVSGGFDLRIAELGCDPVVVNDGVVANLADLEVDHAAGQLLLEIVREGPTVPGPGDGDGTVDTTINPSSDADG